MLFVLKTNIKIIFFSGLLLFLLSGEGKAESPVLFKGIINSPKINIRKTPSLLSEVVGVADKGETVDVLEKQGGIGGWLWVDHRGTKGYIRNRPQYIELPTTASEEKEEPPAEKKAEIKPEDKLEENTEKIKPEKKEAIRADIQTQEKMVETFSQKEVEIVEGLNEIDYALNRARLKAQTLSGEIREMEEKMTRLQKDRERLAQDIARNREYSGERLRALYKMHMLGRLDVAGMPSSVFDFFLRQNSMKSIVKADFNVIDQQNRDLGMFERLEEEMKKEVQAKTLLEAELNDQIRINHSETQKRELILKEIRQKKKLSLAAVESLKLAALQLDSRMETIEPNEVKTAKGDSFFDHQGRLMTPVEGEIISEFGSSAPGNYKVFTFQKGIDIKVVRGEPVKTVFKGEVMFAQWLKGYGNVLIINHGDHYYTLYAHVEEMFKKEGEAVETGDVIATAGDTGSIKGMCLHFEVRHHGKPVDPMKWLRKGA
ncbi:MAG: peptidoglycan DD-metalloendopeptidase family protein [Desulfobacteraceae bacterium]|nr:peptidoglycan DD-metalloendopeptidase family protein [Desulfobacteraceae bacterium]